MTAAEWDSCADPVAMLDFLRATASDRKLRLLACAVARKGGVESLHRLVDDAEEHAARRWLPGRRERAWQEAQQAVAAAQDGHDFRGVYAALLVRATLAHGARACAAQALAAPWLAANKMGVPGPPTGVPPDPAGWCGLLREVAGNPCRPILIHPGWLTWQGGAVANLAQGAYDNRILPAGLLDNARLAVLADALEEAGCADPCILGHLRSGGEHVRGCFVVDALVGKA
jgi:hypothetical protein